MLSTFLSFLPSHSAVFHPLKKGEKATNYLQTVVIRAKSRVGSNSCLAQWN